MTPYEIFPEEVWIHIFDNFKPSQDYTTIWSCYNTSTCFQPILTTQLAASALSICHSYLRKHTYTSQHRLSSRDFLNLRLVSKSWKRIVDTFLQNHHYHFKCHRTSPKSALFLPHTVLPLGKPLTGMIQSCFDFYSSSLRRLSGHPFPSRMVRVNFGNISTATTDELRLFHSNLYTLFNLFGEHIWYLVVYAHISEDSLDHRHLYKFIRLLPNLKMIYFHIIPVPAKAQPRLQETESFPQLKYLTAFMFNKAPGSLICTALQANSHAQKIILQKCSTAAVVSSPWIPSLGVSCDEVHLDTDYLMSCALPKTLRWSASRLYLMATDSCELSLSQKGLLYNMCMAANLFKEKLTSCHVQLECRHRIDKDCYLDLPHLESLTVTFTGRINLDFILKLTALKNLNLRIKSITRLEHWHTQFRGNDQLDVKNNVLCLEDSMIWSRLPNLRKVTVEFSHISKLRNDKNVIVYKKIGKLRICRFQHWRKF